MAINLKKIKSNKKSNGFAVIFVLAFIAMLITIVGDVVYQTQIVAKHTMSIQDQIQAQGTALTGVSIAKVLLKFHMMTVDIGKKNSTLLSAGGISLPTTLYSSLNGVPIGKETLTNNPTLTELIEPPVLDALQKIPGSFVLNVNSESCKFNLNLLQVGRSPEATNAFKNLFATQASQKVLDIYKLDYNTLVDNLVDYLRKIKRPLISVQEIRLVDGFQYDDIYNIYESYFTVWPSVMPENAGKKKSQLLNANCAPIELLAGLFRERPDAEINSILWKNFEDDRGEDKTFKKSDEVMAWFNKNASRWIEDTELKKMLTNLLGYEDFAYRIESTGTVNKTKQKLTVVLRVPGDEKSQSSQQFINEYNQWSR